jgi:hypothetical protein
MRVNTAGRVPKRASVAVATARDALRSSELRSFLDPLILAKPVLSEVWRRAIQEVLVPDERSGCHG